MTTLTYRADLTLSPFGNCSARLREYPDFIIDGADFTDLMNKVQVQLPEFIYMMYCRGRHHVPPFDYHDTLPPGIMPYYINVRVPTLTGESVRQDFYMKKCQVERIDQILEQHPYIKSRTHFYTWAAMKACDALLTNFEEEFDEFNRTTILPDLLLCYSPSDWMEHPLLQSVDVQPEDSDERAVELSTF